MRFGCSQQSISDTERGTPINLTERERMAKVLDSSLSRFLATAEIGAGEKAVLQELQHFSAGAVRDMVFAAIALLVRSTEEQLRAIEGE